MSIFFNFQSSGPVCIWMPQEQAERLKETCFRGTKNKLAGNFLRWACFLHFLQDEETRELLSRQLREIMVGPQENKQYRIELEYSGDVGWDSVLDVGELEPALFALCEEREINRHCRAMFVPEGKIKAFRTDIVTMVLRLRRREYWQLVVGTIYPGADCGELRGGNLTERRGLVFLDWSTPGE